MSLLKEQLCAYDNVKQVMIEKRILLSCDCGEIFYRNSFWADEGSIYGAIENEFSTIYSDKKIYRDQVKQLLQEASLNDVCPYCNKILK
ncbi:MAG: hypothetical protein IKK30_06505 [Clostridia bacterium]|nr:hypothetical protein [Clostridia bacterium]